MAHDVFISYSARDKQDADAVCAILEANRIRCWIAPRDVLPGAKWPETILDGINDSRIMVLLFSSGSNDSEQVMSELQAAVSKGIPIIPLRLEDVPLTKFMQFYIGNRHWLDALTPPRERHFQRLAQTVKLLLSGEQPAEGPLQRQPHRPRRIRDALAAGRRWVSHPSVLSAAILVTLVGVVVAVVVSLLVGLPFGLGQKEESPSPDFSLTSLEPGALDWFGIDLTYSSDGKPTLVTREPQTVGLSSVAEQPGGQGNGSLVFSGDVGVQRGAVARGDLLEFTLSNSGSGITLVDKIWIEVLSWQPYSESSFPVPETGISGSATLSTYEFDVNLNEGQREYVISEDSFKYAYGDADLFRVRITSVDPGIVDFVARVRYRNLPESGENGVLTSPPRRVVFEEQRPWQEFVAEATFTRALLRYPPECYGINNLQENTRFLYLQESCAMPLASADHDGAIVRRLKDSPFIVPQEFMIFSDNAVIVSVSAGRAMISHDKQLIAELIQLFDEAWESAE